MTYVHMKKSCCSRSTRSTSSSTSALLYSDRRFVDPKAKELGVDIRWQGLGVAKREQEALKAAPKGTHNMPTSPKKVLITGITGQDGA